MGDRLGTPGAVANLFAWKWMGRDEVREGDSLPVLSNGHTTLNPPVLVRSLKLSSVGPG